MYMHIQIHHIHHARCRMHEQDDTPSSGGDIWTNGFRRQVEALMAVRHLKMFVTSDLHMSDRTWSMLLCSLNSRGREDDALRLHSLKWPSGGDSTGWKRR